MLIPQNLDYTSIVRPIYYFILKVTLAIVLFFSALAVPAVTDRFN